jgi:hypothetical protein
LDKTIEKLKNFESIILLNKIIKRLSFNLQIQKISRFIKKIIENFFESMNLLLGFLGGWRQRHSEREEKKKIKT